MLDFRPLRVWDPATKERFGFLALVTLVIAGGAWLRMKDALVASFPINDGGLHFILIQELIANQFRLPTLTSYNQLSIPFVYPPLSTYLAAFVHVWFGIAILKILTLAPALFAVCTLIAFAWVAHLALPDRRAVVGALYCFAIAPWDWVQAIKGGGLPRGLGLLLALLAIGFALRIYRKHSNVTRDAICAGALLGLTALSHPEAALFGGLSVAYLHLLDIEHRRGALKSLLIVGVATLVVLCPWVLIVSLRHGVGVFASAGSSNEIPVAANLVLFMKLQMPLWEEVFLPYIAGLVGLVLCLRGQAWLVGWCLVVLVGCVRGTPIYLSVIFSLLGGVAFSSVIAWGETLPFPVDRRLVGLFIALFLTFQLVDASRMIAKSPRSPLQSISAFDQEAALWARWNTPPDARFYVVTGSNVWWNDAVDEWVPALALRRSHTTCQGSEWLPGGQFHRCLEEYDDLQSCLRLSPECQAHLVRMSDKDLIYVSRHLAISDLFLYYLATQKDFVEVFRNDGVRIFRHVS